MNNERATNVGGEPEVKTDASPTNDGAKRKGARTVTPTAVRVDRGTWSGRVQFILACIGSSVGLANVWRFPYVAYEHGGGTFVIAYIITLVTVGIPLYMMEICRGQFSKCGPIAVWKSCPIAVGVGWAMITTFNLGVYYSVVVSYPLIYIASAFRARLPWGGCDEWWGADDHCYLRTAATAEACNGRSTCSSKTVIKETSSQQFWEKYVLNIGASTGVENIDGIQWKIALALFIFYVCSYVCIFRGIKSIGKAVYFTATFPYVILVSFLVQGVMLEGATEGLIFFLNPKWHKLLDFNVWISAASQVIYSLGISNGTIITLASYQPFRNKSYIDALVICVIDFFTSILASLVVFSALGSLAKDLGLKPDKVFAGGQGLAFILFPEVMLRLPIPQLWCVCFFLMLFTLGIDSEFTGIESSWTALFDEYPHLQHYRPYIYLVTVIFYYLLCLPFTTAGGQYLINLMDNYVVLSRMFIAALEVIAIMWIYGIKNFSSDLQQMFGFPPFLFFRISWMLCPFVLGGLTVMSWVQSSAPSYGDYTYPIGAIIAGWFVGVLPFFVIFLSAVVVLYHYWRRGEIWSAFKPTSDWGPANDVAASGIELDTYRPRSGGDILKDAQKD